METAIFSMKHNSNWNVCFICKCYKHYWNNLRAN